MVDNTDLLILGVCSFLAYWLWIIAYNLYFHPLAQFPGPKLAATSYLPELYYNIFFEEGGQFPCIIRKWHDQYGPIIRINPNELHVRDSGWFDNLYHSTRPAWKARDHLRRFGTELSAGGTADPALWKVRRVALNPFFSRRRVAKDAPCFEQNIDKALRIIQEKYVQSGKILSLNSMWGCYAADNLFQMCFGEEANMLECPGFRSPANEALDNLMEATHVFYEVPLLVETMMKIPTKMVLWLHPGMEPILSFKNSISTKISSILAASLSIDGKADDDDKTMFTSMLHQNLPPEEVRHDRLHHEAQTLIGAGVETVARTLTVACFHILDQPALRQRLTTELRESTSSAEDVLSWDALVKLPYLSACIEEACRLTYGIAQRRPRAFFDGPLVYQDWTIPPGTFVGMNNWDVSHDETIFPNSFAFIPERWLGEPLAPDGRPLRSYQIAFGKGTRGCVGIQFAYAQMYIGLAQFMRSDVVERAVLYATDKSDVEMARDQFVPKAPRASKGVRLVFRTEGQM